MTALLVLAAIAWGVVCYVKIAKKAGYSGWWGLVMIIPLAGIIVAWIFPFMDWPIFSNSSRKQSGPNRLGGTTGRTSQTYHPSEASRESNEAQASISAHAEVGGGVTPSRAGNDLTIDENAVYVVVADELEKGTTDKGLWTKLFAEFEGDEKRIKVEYIKQRTVTLQTIAKQQKNQQEHDLKEREAKERADAEERKNREFVEKLATDEQRRKALVHVADYIRENPKCDVNMKIELIRLMGGKFAWDEGIFTFACSADLFGERHSFKNNKLFEKWVVQEVLPNLSGAVSNSE